MAYEIIDPEKRKSYPPVIQAILKKPSPASESLGIELEALDREADRVRVAFNAGEHLCNKWGGLHGGMVAAMLDDLMAIAAGLTLEWGQITPTLEMKTSYIAPGRPGRLVGTGWIIKRGKSVAFIEAALRNAEGELIATASSTARIVTMKRGDKSGGKPAETSAGTRVETDGQPAGTAVETKDQS